MKPFYMWAGGKGKLLKRYEPLWPALADHTSYVEPFFGGGAVFAWIHSQDATFPSAINDVNGELTGLLQCVADDLPTLLTAVDRLLATYLALPMGTQRKAFYYALRKTYWASPDSATLFVLMRLGFNGVWQLCKESKGLFGTPAGLLNHHKVEQIYTLENLQAWSTALRATAISTGSYEAMNFDADGALVYLDPPYRGSFTTYGTGFNDQDQMKLIEWAKAIHGRGATVLLANRSTIPSDGFFEALLPEASFTHFEVSYTAGRRKREANGGHSAKAASEFLAILSH